MLTDSWMAQTETRGWTAPLKAKFKKSSLMHIAWQLYTQKYQEPKTTRWNAVFFFQEGIWYLSQIQMSFLMCCICQVYRNSKSDVYGNPVVMSWKWLVPSSRWQKLHKNTITRKAPGSFGDTDLVFYLGFVSINVEDNTNLVSAFQRKPTNRERIFIYICLAYT